jgi:hypothetical protein
MRRIVAGLAAFAALIALASITLLRRDVDPSPTEALRARYARKAAPSVDHSRFP